MSGVGVEHIWKRFQLRHDRADSVGQLLLQMVPRRRQRRPETFWALRDVSFEMPPGLSLGVIGSNGSGKSTLLKLITGTMLPTSGHISVKGKVSALIELGAGFHPDFTGRENIILNASILGVRRRDIERRMEDIIEFAGIREFIDTPVKYYSSGMYARLGFSVAIHVEPDVLLVDEVLAVGDDAFQQKCMERIFEIKRNGIGILLVSHDLGSIERLMDRVVWIEKGVLQDYGDPRSVVHAYRSHEQRLPDVERRATEVLTSPSFVGLTGYIRSPGRPTDMLASGAPLDLVFNWQNRAGHAIQGGLVASLRRLDGLEITRFSTFDDGHELDLPPGSSLVALHLSEVHLPAGTYEFDVVLTTRQGQQLAEWRPLLQFRVHSAQRQAGLFIVPHQWTFRS